jgi:hypothetical protein
MQLDLSSDETTLLTEVLSSALGDVREGVYQAAVPDYKAALKQRESLIRGLLDRLNAGEVRAS